jgi:hypothetical protein
MRLLIIILAVTLWVPAVSFAQVPEGLPENPPTASAAAREDGVKGLSWFEITTFSPAFTPVDDGFVKRMEATWKLKLRAFRRNAAFPAKFNPDPNLRAQWKKVVEECTRIIKGS